MKQPTLVKDLLVIIAIIAVSVPAIAIAAQDDELNLLSEDVAYVDLNMTQEADAYTLYRRLQRASERVCGVESLRNARTLRELAQMHDCYQQAMTAAVDELDNDELTRILRK